MSYKKPFAPTDQLSLDGMTPSEVAGLDLDLEYNKWKGLIEKAIKNGKVEPEKTVNKERLEYWF